MKSNAAIEREIKAVVQIINARPNYIGPRGSRKYAVAFAVYEALRWARGRREDAPSTALITLDARYGKENTNA